LWAAGALLVAGLVAVLYVLFAAPSKPGAAPGGMTRFAQGPMHALSVMDKAPAMPTRAIKDAKGGEVRLADLGGDLIVMNLWATWCAPCMEEMPTLGALQRHYDPARVHVVPVNLDEDTDHDKALAELNALSQNTLPLYTDSSRSVLFDVEAAGMPTTIFYRHGREIARLSGAANWDSPQARAAIEAALLAP
jgi:thiol-disulfide isomerase/thioredoxin